MLIQNIRIINFRNIVLSDLNPSPNFNFIFGPNGAGKTSLLEAIYCLGLGKSFRNPSLRRCVLHDAEHFQLGATISEKEPQQSTSSQIRFSKSRQGARKATLDNELQTSMVNIAQLLPVQYVGVDTNDLFLMGAQYRRRFLDWGVFHVEHRFYQVWRDYNKLLKQRNVLIKQKAVRSELEAWDDCLDVLARDLDVFRASYIHALTVYMNDLWSEFGFKGRVEMIYRRGWDAGKSFRQCLRDNYHKEISVGYSIAGPQRANIVFRCDGHLVSETFSQGQQKLLSYILRLSQGLLMKEKTKRSSVYIIDDLPSEFDLDRIQRVINILQSLNAQVFVTAVEDSVCDKLSDMEGSSMFHVEHGCFQPLTCRA